MEVLPSFFGWPGDTPPSTDSHLGMGSYESLPGSNDAQRRRRVWWQRGALLVVGSAVAVLLLVLSDSGDRVRHQRWGDGDEEGPRLSSATIATTRGVYQGMTHLIQPSLHSCLTQQYENTDDDGPSSLTTDPDPRLWRGGGWLLPTPLLPFGTKPTREFTPPTSGDAATTGSSEGGGRGRKRPPTRHHNANGHGKPRHSHQGHKHQGGKEEAAVVESEQRFGSRTDKGEGKEENGACDIFIGVASRPGAVAERAAMRATWLGQLVSGEFGGAWLAMGLGVGMDVSVTLPIDQFIY